MIETEADRADNEAGCVAFIRRCGIWVVADAGQRRETLEQSERLMLSDYPLVPLYYFVSKRLVKPYVQGVIVNPMNHIRSQSLTVLAH